MENNIKTLVTDLFKKRKKGQDEKTLQEFDAIFQEIPPDKRYKFILDSIDIFVELRQSSVFIDFSDTENIFFGDAVWNKRNDAIRDIKSDFDRLSYPEKLVYWKENIDANIDQYICDDDLTVISVLPQNNEQVELHDVWEIKNSPDERTITFEKLRDVCLKNILEMCPDETRPVDAVIEYIHNEINTHTVNIHNSEGMPKVITIPGPKTSEFTLSPDDQEQFYITERVRLIYVDFLKRCTVKLEKYDITGDISIIDWITMKKTEHELEKIKWNCSPAILGFLFGEFVKQNFIEPPLYNGEVNITGRAKLCWKYFEIQTESEEYFIKQFRNSILSDTKRQKFNIPALKDLT